MKSTWIRLFKLWLPRWKRIRVSQITVGGFVALLNTIAGRAAATRIGFDRDITQDDLIRSFREPEFCAFGDAVCPDEEPEFLKRWMTLANVRELITASCLVNNWARIFSCISFGGQPKRRGNIYTDINALCHMFPGLTPQVVRHWPMEEFMDVCESLNLMAMPEDPTTDPDVRPMSAVMLSQIPGIEVVH